MKSIPTQYRGVNFRSRLEAKWAMMFDGLGWHWEYEPFELDGYIPDFILAFNGHQVLVEVKPIVGLSASSPPQAVIDKIINSGWSETFNVLRYKDGHTFLIRDAPVNDGEIIGTKEAAKPFLIVGADVNRGLGLYVLAHSVESCRVFYCPRCERHQLSTGLTGYSYCHPCDKPAVATDLVARWNVIKNKTQWRPAA